MSDIMDVDSEELKKQLIAEAEDRMHKAAALAFTVQTDGWQILLDTFESMKEDQLVEMFRHTPGNDKEILAAHSVWFTTVHTLESIKSAINRAIQDGEQAKLDLVQLLAPPSEIDLSI